MRSLFSFTPSDVKALEAAERKAGLPAYIAKGGRSPGLLGGAPQGQGLLGSQPSSQPQREGREVLDAVYAVADQFPSFEPRQEPRGNLARPNQDGPREDPDRLGRIGRFVDDFLFGGAYSDRRAERDAREQQRAYDSAHRDAYMAATGEQGFDPNAYARRMAELGQAPDLDRLQALEGLTDSRDVRGARSRQERRQVTGGLLAPLMNRSPEEQAQMLPVVGGLLGAEGFEAPKLTPEMIAPSVSVALGAGGFLDNIRADAALNENVRAAQADEAFRQQEFGLRQTGQEMDEAYRRQRAEAQDAQWAAEMAFRREQARAEEAYRRWEAENAVTRSDIEGRVLRKAIEGGVGALTPEERAVYDRAVTPQGFNPMMAGGLYTGAAAAPPASGSGTQDNPARPQSQQDYDRLPRGAYFIDPDDGQLYRK